MVKDKDSKPHRFGGTLLGMLRQSEVKKWKHTPVISRGCLCLPREILITSIDKPWCPGETFWLLDRAGGRQGN